VKGIPTRKVGRIMRHIKAHLKELYGSEVRQVVLYGSHARGEATNDSDIDVAIIVSDNMDRRAVELSLEDILFDVLADDGELVSIVTMPENMFKDLSSPYIMNVKEDGVVI